MTLAWEPKAPTGTDFRVYQRETGEAYNYSTPAWPADGVSKKATTCTIGNLEVGRTYYFVVRACDGNKESDDSNEVSFLVGMPAAKTPPTADAGANQTVKEDDHVVLDGSTSFARNGAELSYQYEQIAGPDVTLDCGSSKCSFKAPPVKSTMALIFQLSVEADTGLRDTAKTVVIVNPAHAEKKSPEPPPVQDNGNHPPTRPAITSPAEGAVNVNTTPWITASPFDDPDTENHHLLTQWQIWDLTTQNAVMGLICTENYLNDIALVPLMLDPAGHYSVRVRFFDNNGLASQWSHSVAFYTVEQNDDTNLNQIPDMQEFPTDTDMNGDDIADIDQQNLIQSVSTHDGSGIIGISIENGGAETIAAAADIDPHTLDLAPDTGSVFPFGLVAAKIRVAQPGDSAYTTIYLSESIFPDNPHDSASVRWMRYDSATGWQDSSATTDMDADGFVVERMLRDGGTNDADGVANGVIIDLSAPVHTDSDNADQTADTGSSGSGCFIGSIF